MRALVIVTVVMGILILFGTAGLVAIIVQRLHSAAQPVHPIVLDEPAGTHIAAITGAADRLAVALQGGGPDRVLLLDPHTGAVLGRVALPQ